MGAGAAFGSASNAGAAVVLTIQGTKLLNRVMDRRQIRKDLPDGITIGAEEFAYVDQQFQFYDIDIPAVGFTRWL